MSKRSQQIDAFFRQGQHLHMAGRLAEAEQIYRQVIAAAPRHADALHALGALALQSGNPAIAETLLIQAIGLRPSADYHLTHANVLLALNRPEDAEKTVRLLLRARPHSAAAHQVLGHALSDSLRPNEAIEAYRKAFTLQPGLPDIRNNLGMALRQAGRLAEAEQEFRQAPPEPEALVNLSSVQKERGAFVEAEATLRQALRLAPDAPVLRYNWALLMLLLGRTEEAWDGWEQRFRAGAIPGRAFPQPQWQGEPLGNRTLLVHAEQGLGDVIQFARYLPAINGHVVFEAPPRLVRLLSSNPAMPAMIASGTPPHVDIAIPLLSLPARTGVRPAEPPYLFADPDRVASWQQRIGTAGVRVGINWQGFSGRFEDKGRSLPLALFRPLAAVPGVRLISLQKGEGEEQIPAAGFPLETLPGLDSGPDAFLDTAAVMMTLDLVVTSDTSIAHLAGALGCPVWVALRRGTGLALDAGPLGQPLVSDDAAVSAGIRWRLGSRLRGHDPRIGADGVIDVRSSPTIPVSWGELLDRITILQIKTHRLRAPEARANAACELALLCQSASFPPGMAELQAALLAVNTRLWRIEDRICQMEAAKDFGPGSIALARAVYRENDERTRIKQAINRQLGSWLTEEKQYAAY